METRIFLTSVFGKDRMFINWLEFWVYTCNDGHEPKEDEWMVALEETEEVPADLPPLFAELGRRAFTKKER